MELVQNFELILILLNTKHFGIYWTCNSYYAMCFYTNEKNNRSHEEHLGT